MSFHNSMRNPSTLTGVQLGLVPIMLHSQANHSIYPNNVMSDFTMRFNRPLVLLGPWTMSLTSVEYTNSIVNVEKMDVESVAQSRLNHMATAVGGKVHFTARLLSRSPSEDNQFCYRRIPQDINFTLPLTHDLLMEGRTNEDIIRDLVTAMNVRVPANRELMPTNHNRHGLRLRVWNINPDIRPFSGPPLFDTNIDTAALKVGTLVGIDLLQHICSVLNLCYNADLEADKKRFFIRNNRLVMRLNMAGHMALSFSGESDVGNAQLRALMGRGESTSTWSLPWINLTSESTCEELEFPEDINAFAFHQNFAPWSTDYSREFSFEMPYSTAQSLGVLRKCGEINGFRYTNGIDLGKDSTIEDLTQTVFDLSTGSYITDFNHLRLSYNIDCPPSYRLYFDSNILKTTFGWNVQSGGRITTDGSSMFTNQVDTSLFLDKASVPLSELFTVDQESPTSFSISMRQHEATAELPASLDTPTRYGYTYMDLLVSGVEGEVAYNPFTQGQRFAVGDTSPEVVRVFEERSYSSQMEEVPIDSIMSIRDKVIFTHKSLSDGNSLAKQRQDLEVKNTSVQLKLGWWKETQTDKRSVEIAYMKTKDITSPGCYSRWESLIQEIFELYSREYVTENQSINLKTLLSLGTTEGTNKAYFRLKVHRPKGKELKINYLELTFSNHISQMIGLVEPVGDKESLGCVKLMSLRPVAANRNVVDAELPNIPGGTVIEETADEMKSSFTPPHILNCDLGITDMYIHFPGTIESMTVGNTTAPLACSLDISSTPNARVKREILNPIPHKLTTESIEDIRVQIHDRSGQRIKFSDSLNGVIIEALFKRAE